MKIPVVVNNRIVSRRAPQYCVCTHWLHLHNSTGFHPTTFGACYTEGCECQEYEEEEAKG